MVLIGAIFLLPVTLLVVLLYLQINGDVSFYRLERVGVTYTAALRPLFTDLEAYRLSGGDRTVQAALATRVDRDFESARAVDAGPGRELALTGSLATLSKEWAARQSVAALLDDFIVLLGAVSDNSKITLDPILDGYYVGDTMVNKVPTLIDSADQANTVAKRWLSTGSISASDRVALTILTGQVAIARQGIDHNVGIAMGTDQRLLRVFRAPLARERNASTAFTTWLDVHLLKSSTPNGTPAQLTAAQIDVTFGGFALYDAAIGAMADVLDRRIDSLIHREITIFVIVLLAIASAAALMVATTRSMSRHLADKVSLQHEIVERIQVEERLAFAAFNDELTGLANRALLMDRLNHLAARRYAAEHLWAIVFMDLDRFKVVNDSLGHKAGDLVLIESARRLERCVRAGDTLARLGGDEFVILLEDIDDVEQACTVAQRALRAFEAPFIVGGQEVFASASFGIATCHNNDDTPDDVMRNADIAMYRAKQLGKQRYELFSPELLTSAVLRLELETDLARALERKEFCVFYQPLISMQNGHLTGFEALVRWRHPRRGLVNPDDFIPIAEENGAIIAIGEWVFNEACRQLREWQLTLAGAGDLRMNINVSAKQLAAPDFIPTLENALARTGVAARNVNLEITESVLMTNADQARVTLARVRGLGLKIHLDDFGTGYSSLSYLREFPIDSLKIDRSFISGPDDGEAAGLASTEIVRSIINLAQSLSLSVTAEGTETAEQVEALRQLGCTNVQGFHFSRPVEASAATDMIATPLAFDRGPARAAASR